MSKFSHLPSIILVSLGALLLHGQQSPQPSSIGVDWVYMQKGSPLQVFGHVMTSEEFYEKTFVANVSSRTIVNAQLGWIVYDRAHKERAVAFLGTPFDLNL